MWGRIAQVSDQKRPIGVLTFSGFSHGLNTVSPESQIRATECSNLLNWEILKNGTLATRRPIVVYTASETDGAVKEIKKIPIGGISYELLVDENYKLYYLDTLVPNLIGTLEGDAKLLAYNGVALVLDGSYIKYLDDVSEIKMAYDTGTGTSGYQFYNLDGGDDTGLALGNGTNVRIAYKFTSQTWTAGYTIPPTKVSCVLQRVLNGFTGTDNVNISAVLRKVSDSSVLATKTLVSAPILSNVSDTATTYSTTFASTDITTEMSPGVAYYLSIEYNNGDAANYVSVRCASTTGNAYKYIATWSAETAYDPLISLSPGKPPKGSFGDVANRRAFIAGDPDNPGYVWFCNATHLDWSTADGGGYVGAVDDNKNNFEVGGIAALYKDLYVFGTEDQPFLCQLTGTTPSAYTLPSLFQNVWALPNTTKGIGNDIAFASSEGIKLLSGVKEYGDLRTFSATDQIDDRFLNYWSDDSIVGYYPKKAQLWLAIPGYHRTIVLNMKAVTADPSGVGLRYPVSEFEFCLDDLTGTYSWVDAGDDVYYMTSTLAGDPGFLCSPDAITIDGAITNKASAIASIEDHEWWYGDNDTLGFNTVYFKDATGSPGTSGVVLRSILIPTSLSSYGGSMFVGGSGGYVYTVDEDAYKDMDSFQILPVITTNNSELPFSDVEFNEIQFIIESRGGAAFRTYFYIDGKRSDYHTSETTYLEAADDLTVGEATAEVTDLYSSLDPITSPIDIYINFVTHSLKITIKDITLAGFPLYLNGFILKYGIMQQ